jgi:short-subunit dehydrogenase
VTARIDESTVLLTGATGGIGRALARALHERGASLVLTGRNADLLESLAAALGSRAETVVADLASRDDVAALARRADVDVLVANAAVPASGRLVTFTADEVDRALEVNLRAPIQLALAMLPAMLERGRGHLVFVSSMSGKVAAAGGSVYSATKFGLRGFGYSLNDELRGSGVGATTIFPGFVSDAGFFAESGARLPRGTGTRTPEQVAEAVVEGVEKGAAEIDVAPLSFSVGARMFGLAPSATNRLMRALGSGKVARQLEEGQRDKR